MGKLQNLKDAIDSRGIMRSAKSASDFGGKLTNEIEVVMLQVAAAAAPVAVLSCAEQERVCPGQHKCESRFAGGGRYGLLCEIRFASHH